MALRKAEKVEALILELNAHPLIAEKLALLEDRVNDFVSQFEMGVPHRGKTPDAPRLAHTVAFEPQGMRELAEDIFRQRISVDRYLNSTIMAMPVDITVKGPRAEECAELLTDALKYSGIEYGQQVHREKNGAFSVGCRPETDAWQEQMDALHDFAQANFDHHRLLAATHAAERKLKSLAKARPGLAASTQIDKSYTSNAKDHPVLHLHYQTGDEALVAFARSQGPEITVRKIREEGRDAHVINAHFKDAGRAEPKCAALLAEIQASAERAPIEQGWQTREPSPIAEKAAKIGKRADTPTVRAR